MVIRLPPDISSASPLDSSNEGKSAFGELVGTHRLEKGSRYLLRTLKSMKLEDPFFLFVNLMDCHEPYNWESHDQLCSISQYSYITGRPVSLACNWRQRYPTHVSLGLSRLSKVLAILKPFFNRSLIVVTSDHGQSLGEHSRIGHGPFLEEEQVRVPLYVRYPENVQPVAQHGEFISLTSISAMIQDVIEGGSAPMGNDFALSESFGPTRDVTKLLNGDSDSESFERSFAHRVMIHSKGGTGVYNKITNRLEGSCGNLAADEASAYADTLPLFEEGKHVFKTLSEYTTEEEDSIRGHLRELGYD